jgi:proteasome accessory factor B
MNLVIALLVARTYVARSRIREVVDGYDHQSDATFERMFERDKEELRSLGVPIETGSADSYFDDEPGYRIRRERFQLPPLDLAADEAAVLGLAAQVWEQAGLASATTSALRKLGAAGVPTDRAVLGAVEPRIAAVEPAFEPLLAAAVDRRPVVFDYRRSGSGEVGRRRVQPWGLGLWHGRWYLVGFDVDRGERRLFRLGRVVGAVATEGLPGAFGPPPDRAVHEALANLDSVHGEVPTAGGTATIRVRAGAGLGLRRRATPQPAPEQRAADAGGVDRKWDTLELAYGDAGVLAEEIVGYGPDAVAVSPNEVRDAVVERLRAVLATVTAAAR